MVCQSCRIPMDSRDSLSPPSHVFLGRQTGRGLEYCRLRVFLILDASSARATYPAHWSILARQSMEINFSYLHSWTAQANCTYRGWSNNRTSAGYLVVPVRYKKYQSSFLHRIRERVLPLPHHFWSPLISLSLRLPIQWLLWMVIDSKVVLVSNRFKVTQLAPNGLQFRALGYTFKGLPRSSFSS
jgi:hypothetical protein